MSYGFFFFFLVFLCKVVIYNYILCWLLFHVKFDCILFNHFLVFFVGFNVRVECESYVKICEESEFATGSQVDNPKRPREKHMLEFEQSHARLDFTNHFMTLTKSQVTRETLCLEHFKVCFPYLFFIFYQNYISSHYPQNCKEFFQETFERENPSNTLES